MPPIMGATPFIMAEFLGISCLETSKVALIPGPTLVHFGAKPLAARMFIFYSSLLSPITPPVALAAYAGAAIAGGKVMETGFIASRLGFVKFIVPYKFIYNTALLSEGSSFFVAWSLLTAIIGTVATSVAFDDLRPEMAASALPCGRGALPDSETLFRFPRIDSGGPVDLASPSQMASGKAYAEIGSSRAPAQTDATAFLPDFQISNLLQDFEIERD